MNAISRYLTVILLAGLLTGLSGCVTTAQIDEAMSLARQAQADAAAASVAAGKAANAADEAKRTAENAQRAANAAAGAAAEANKCCAANSEKIDRAFKESMKK